MKKRTLAFLILLTLLVFVFSLCSCKNNTNEDEPKSTVQETNGECTHKWEIKSKLLPTCMSEGETVTQCAYCHDISTHVIPKTDCEYEVSWSWRYKNTAALLYLTCPLNSSHNYKMIGNITSEYGGDLLLAATCHSQGKIRFSATATYGGITYTNEKIQEISFAPHKYEAITIPLGDFCYSGIQTVNKCTVCGYIDKSSQEIDFVHEEVTTVEHYNLEDYGYCGGYIKYSSCKCGALSYLDIAPSCDDTVQVNQLVFESHETGEKHMISVLACRDCNLSITTETGTLQGGDEIMEIYEKKKITLNESTVLSYSFAKSSTHEEMLAHHNISKAYEYLGDSCKDGYFVCISCSDCPYEKKFYTKGHYLIDEKTPLNEFCPCSAEVTLTRCHCGYIDDIYFENSCNAVGISLTEHFGTDIEVFSSNDKAYKCTECNVSYFVGYVIERLEDNGKPLTLIYKICSVKSNGQLVFEAKSSNYGFLESKS